MEEKEVWKTQSHFMTYLFNIHSFYDNFIYKLLILFSFVMAHFQISSILNNYLILALKLKDWFPLFPRTLEPLVIPYQKISKESSYQFVFNHYTKKLYSLSYGKSHWLQIYWRNNLFLWALKASWPSIFPCHS